MNKTVIHCRTTAPMFIAGAVGEKNERGRDVLIPELRSASIKGVMRFIWRAIQCAPDENKLREDEGQLFGNAFGGKTTKQSDMRLRVENTRLIDSKERMVPHRDLDEYKRENNGGNKPSFPGRGFKSGGSFDVVISSFGDESAHADFVRLFALTVLLYGFGRRTRKGFGTVEVVRCDGIGNDIDFTYNGAADNLNRLSKYGAHYTLSSADRISVSAGKSAEYPYIEDIRVIETASGKNAEQIRAQIGMAAHHFTGSTFLGTDQSMPRFASSVLLSTVPWSGAYRCIVTQLHCTKGFSKEKRDKFYAELEARV